MDARLRQLERQYAASGSPDDLDMLLRAMLQINGLEEWELAAETEDSLARRVISHLRNFGKPVEYDYTGDPIQHDSECFVNVYEDFTARTTIYCFLSQVSRTRGWLRDFYTRHQLFYQGWQGDTTEYPVIEDQFDAILGPINYMQLTPTDDPPAKIVINHSDSCFRLYPGEIVDEARSKGFNFEGFTDSAIRILSPINRWGQRDYPVSFGIIESYETEQSEVESALSTAPAGPYWMNAYRTWRESGGPEGGGWHYSVKDPMASIYIGSGFLDDSPMLDEVSNFISEIYSGLDLRVEVQAHPALAEPHQRPYYE
jgi:hypothetical protein